MWVLYNIPAIQGYPRIFGRLTAVCCMLLPHNPYRIPQHYKRHVCGPSCSCKHRYLLIYPIFEHYFCLNYMGTVCHWKPFWSTISVRFISQCWYFNPQWTPVQAVNKASSVWIVLVSLDKMHSCCVLTYRSGYLEGFRRWRGSILAPHKTLTFMGPAAYQNTPVFRIGVNKIPPNFDTLFATSL